MSPFLPAARPHSDLARDPIITHEVRRDLAELFEGGFKVNDDLLGEDTGISGG